MKISELCTLQHVHVEDVVRESVRLTPGTKMVKLDIRSAYRIIPVHQQDQYLLGMMWEEQVYVNAAGVCQCSITIRFKVSSYNLYGAGRCHWMDSKESGSQTFVALFG